MKRIIAGHVRTSESHTDGSHEVFHDGASHFYIDASVEETGRLNVPHYDVESGEFNWQMTPAMYPRSDA